MTTDVEPIFIDTNILIYATNDESPFQEKATGLLNQLIARGIECAICPQIIREYLVVFTRGESPDKTARSVYGWLDKEMQDAKKIVCEQLSLSSEF